MLYPVGQQDFADIRRDGFVNVDKTELVYKMSRGGKYYFRCHPRRFGKLKRNETAQAAPDQINEKGYAHPCKTDRRPFVKLVPNISDEARHITDHPYERINLPK